MPFTPKRILVVGATSGIGQAMASRLAKAGSGVIVVGRRQERLQQFVKDHANVKVPVKSYALDLAKTDTIEPWAKTVIAENPDLDSVLINSGIQRGMDLTKPESIDWAVFEDELRVNYIGHVVLAMAFVPFLQKQTAPSLIFMSSGLAMAPLPRVPGYSAAKAAAHHFAMSLRYQLKGGSLKIIEIFPPLVASELQDQQGADAAYGRAFGMPVDKFVDDAFAGLDAGKDQIPVGMAVGNFDAIEPKREEAMGKLAMGVVGMLQKIANGA